MSQTKRMACRRFVLFFLPIFALSVFWPGLVSAAPWDDFLKKAEEAITDKMDDALDGDKKSEQPQESVQQATPVQQNPAAELTPEELSKHTMYGYQAGIYAGLLDSCKEPAGAQVRAEFDARTATVPADAEKYMTATFDQQYKSKYNPSKARCNALATQKQNYEASLQALGGPLVVANATPGATASTMPLPDPQLSELARYAGIYAGHTDLCNKTIGSKVRTDFLSHIAAEASEHKKMLTQSFDSNRKEQPKLWQGRCSVPSLEGARQAYEHEMRAIGATPIADDGPPTVAVAPGQPTTPDKATSGNSNTAEECDLSPIERMACGQIAGNPSDYAPCKVAACKKLKQPKVSGPIPENSAPSGSPNVFPSDAFAVATVDDLLTRNGNSTATAAQIMSKLEARGFDGGGSFSKAIITAGKMAQAKIDIRCGKKLYCLEQERLGYANVQMTGASDTVPTMPFAVLAHLNDLLGMDPTCGVWTGQRLQGCKWQTPPLAPHVDNVVLTGSTGGNFSNLSVSITGKK